MTQQQIAQKVYQIIAEKLDINENQINKTSNIVQDLGGKQKDVEEIMLALDFQFNIIRYVNDLSSIHTASDMINYVNRK